jgi:hypothetical protein
MYTDDSKPALLYRWHQLINQAAQHARIEVDETLRHYLLLTVLKYLQSDELAKEAQQMNIHQITISSAEHWKNLQKRADHCLIMSGLFPDHILHKPARLNEYVRQGKRAFDQLSELLHGSDANLFQQLSDQFISLIEILHSLRYFSGTDALSPLCAFELWSDTGSQSAYRQITYQHKALPLSEHMSSQRLH